MLGNHADSGKSGPIPQRGKNRFRVPFSMPTALLNRHLLTVFNSGFYHISHTGPSREGLDGFFYPLDRIRDWNRLYGKHGFFQYQCVLPDPNGEAGVVKILEFFSANNLGAFLSVLKRCGEDTSMLPFCRKGYTLALDIPYRGKVTLQLLDKLDDITVKFGGRVYLTKDARLRGETFRAMYPEYKSWMETVRRYNPEALGNSRLAERLELWKS